MTDEIHVPDAEHDRWRLVINQLKIFGTCQEANTNAINMLNTTIIRHLENHTNRPSLAPFARQVKRLPRWAQVLIALLSTSGITAVIAAAMQ